ncbi:hypothetical protein Hanom_Chr16g01495671 [Helianthus anomalus]
MDGVKESDENGKDFKPFGSRCEKTNLWTKGAKLAKPQGRKWHFTLLEIFSIRHHRFCSLYKQS